MPVNQGNALIVVDEDHLGTAMRALTPLQQKYVVALLETGGEKQGLAAQMAGYGGGRHACETRAYELNRNMKVLAAIQEEALKRMKSGSLMASSKLYMIAANDHHKDQLKAVDMLLNRGGLVVQTQHKLVIEDTRTDDEVIARTVAMAKQLGMDVKPLLAKLGVEVEDAEFTEVPKVSKTDTLREQVSSPVLESPQIARTSEHDDDDLSDFLLAEEDADD